MPRSLTERYSTVLEGVKAYINELPDQSFAEFYEQYVPYTYNQQSLEALAARVKANIEKPIKVEKVDIDWTYNAGDYYYRNTGGLYNPETGRFCVGTKAIQPPNI